jgi:hypothetical protein
MESYDDSIQTDLLTMMPSSCHKQKQSSRKKSWCGRRAQKRNQRQWGGQKTARTRDRRSLDVWEWKEIWSEQPKVHLSAMGHASLLGKHEVTSHMTQRNLIYLGSTPPTINESPSTPQCPIGPDACIASFMFSRLELLEPNSSDRL